MTLAAKVSPPGTGNDLVLKVDSVSTSYGAIRAVSDVSLTVARGEVVCLLGANGAGKTTLLKTISGELKPSAGSVEFNGRSIVGWAPHQTVRLGISHVLEGRQVFRGLSVMENLMLGATARGHDTAHETTELLLAEFPVLREKQDQLAGRLSGGQQQMVAISRALMSRPELLLLDEPSLGLAPIVMRSVVNLIRWSRERFGTSILLVEQHTGLALALASRAYILSTGRVVFDGSASDLREGDALRAAYLGGTREALNSVREK
jgi:branched-chain amino acid transport system ATP-binding protein